jgi:hypothetical protein
MESTLQQNTTFKDQGMDISLEVNLYRIFGLILFCIHFMSFYVVQKVSSDLNCKQESCLTKVVLHFYFK